MNSLFGLSEVDDASEMHVEDEELNESLSVAMEVRIHSGDTLVK